jgi:23S rRNA (uridine2552-2'-O)-methyltransferase
MKRSKPSKTWEDHYTRRAKKEHFPARSVYKLKEMQRKYRLIKKGHKVLDLGCSPGSWLLYAAEQVGTEGRVVGIDLKPTTARLPAHARVYTADILSPDEKLWIGLGIDFNVVLSDMAPATTGSRITDAARSHALCQAALNIARERLVSGGSFICKIFQSEELKIFIDAVNKTFVRYKIFKPESSRKASREIYIIAMEKR